MGVVQLPGANAQGYVLVSGGSSPNFGYSSGGMGSLTPTTWIGANHGATVVGLRSTGTRDLILEISGITSTPETWRFIAIRQGATFTTVNRTAFSLNIIGGTTFQYLLGTGSSPVFNSGNVGSTFQVWMGE